MHTSDQSIPIHLYVHTYILTYLHLNLCTYLARPVDCALGQHVDLDREAAADEFAGAGGRLHSVAQSHAEDLRTGWIATQAEHSGVVRS